MKNKIKEYSALIHKIRKKINDFTKSVYPEYNEIFHQVFAEFDCPTSPIKLCIFELSEKGIPERCLFCHLSVNRNK